MQLTKQQVADLYNAATRVSQAINLVNAVHFDQNDMTVRKLQAALDEINYELDNYELI